MSDCRIIVGDCLAIMPTLDADSVDAVVCDPPYGTQGEAGGYGRRQLYAGKYGRRIAGDVDLSAMEAALPLMVRALKPDAWLALFGAPRRTGALVRAFEGAGLDIFGEVIWDKGVPGLGYHIRYSHEVVYICRKGDPPRPAEALLSVCRVAAGRVAAGAAHPHAKPVPLLRRLVRWCCPPGGLVLDPFAGCGPVGVAAVLEGRRYLGVEVDEGYAAVASARIATADDQGALSLDFAEGA